MVACLNPKTTENGGKNENTRFVHSGRVPDVWHRPNRCSSEYGPRIPRQCCRAWWRVPKEFAARNVLPYGSEGRHCSLPLTDRRSVAKITCEGDVEMWGGEHPAKICISSRFDPQTLQSRPSSEPIRNFQTRSISRLGRIAAIGGMKARSPAIWRVVRSGLKVSTNPAFFGKRETG